MNAIDRFSEKTVDEKIRAIHRMNDEELRQLTINYELGPIVAEAVDRRRRKLQYRHRRWEQGIAAP